MAESYNPSRQRRRVKQSNKSIGLLGLKLHGKPLEILKYLGAGNYAGAVAHMPTVKCSKQNVSYWKTKFIQIGALQLQTKDVYQVFSLTPFGQKLLTRSEGFVGEVLVLEDFPFKFDILEGERRRIDWVKLGSPRNWLKLGARVGGVRVVRTSGSIIVHPGRFRGWDARELEYLAVRTVDWVKNVLQDRFGMVLSDEGVRLHEPVFRFPSEEAREDVKNGTVIVEGVGSIDASPPERRPHEEYSGVERAHARLLLPDSVRRLELKVDVVIDNLVKLTGVVDKLANSISGLFQQSDGENHVKPLREDYSS